MANSEPLEQLASEIADSLCDWMAEGEQQAQVAQDDDAYWQYLRGKLVAYLEDAYNLGWAEAESNALSLSRLFHNPHGTREPR